MNRDAIPTTLEGLSNVFLQDANRLQEELDRYTPFTRELFVVTVQDLPIGYADGKPTVTSLRDATRFADAYVAQSNADVTFNVRGQVRMLQHAYVAQIEHLRKLAADLIVEAHYQGV